jgi:hypothetical protein
MAARAPGRFETRRADTFYPILATPTASTASIITFITSCSDTVGCARHCESFLANENGGFKKSGWCR